MNLIEQIESILWEVWGYKKLARAASNYDTKQYYDGVDDMAESFLKAIHAVMKEFKKEIQDYYLTYWEFTILNWAAERHILKESSPDKQHEKKLEEIDEYIKAFKAGDRAAILDGIGDIMVCFIVQLKMQETSINECMRLVWDEIKDRKGKMKDGLFVRDNSVNIEHVCKNCRKVIIKNFEFLNGFCPDCASRPKL